MRRATVADEYTPSSVRGGREIEMAVAEAGPKTTLRFAGASAMGRLEMSKEKRVPPSVKYLRMEETMR